MIYKTDTDDNSERIMTEGALQGALQDLQKQIVVYESAKIANDPFILRVEEQKVVEGMRRVGENHPDPGVRQEWNDQADAFRHGDHEEKKHILGDLGRGLRILLMSPFWLAGGVFLVVGGMINGVGCALKGMGTALTGGYFRGKRLGFPNRKRQ